MLKQIINVFQSAGKIEFNGLLYTNLTLFLLDYLKAKNFIKEASSSLTFIGETEVIQITKREPKWKIHQAKCKNPYYVECEVIQADENYFIISPKLATLFSILKLEHFSPREEYAILTGLHSSYYDFVYDDNSHTEVQLCLLNAYAKSASVFGYNALATALQDMMYFIADDCVLDFKIDNLLYDEKTCMIKLWDVLYN